MTIRALKSNDLKGQMFNSTRYKRYFSVNYFQCFTFTFVSIFCHKPDILSFWRIPVQHSSWWLTQIRFDPFWTLFCFSAVWVSKWVSSQKANRMSGDLPLNINIKEPRWDQGTFMGRAQHFFMVTDPRNVLLSSEVLEDARVTVENYRCVIPKSWIVCGLWTFGGKSCPLW